MMNPVRQFSPELAKVVWDFFNSYFDHKSNGEKEDNHYWEQKIKFEGRADLPSVNNEKSQLKFLKKAAVLLFIFCQEKLKFEDESIVNFTFGEYMRTSGSEYLPAEDNTLTRIIFNFGCNEIYYLVNYLDARDAKTFFLPKDSFMIVPTIDRKVVVYRRTRNSADDFQDGRVINRTLVRPNNYRRGTVLVDISKPVIRNENDETLISELTQTLETVMSQKGVIDKKKTKKLKKLKEKLPEKLTEDGDFVREVREEDVIQPESLP